MGRFGGSVAEKPLSGPTTNSEVGGEGEGVGGGGEGEGVGGCQKCWQCRQPAQLEGGGVGVPPPRGWGVVVVGGGGGWPPL